MAERYRLVSLQRDPIAKIKVAGLSGKPMAEWRDRRLKEVPWMRPLLILALETAMRRSELLALRWADVFLSDRFAGLHDTKNGEPRDVPLSTRAHSVLDGLPRHISGKVFPITGDAVKKAFTRAVGRARIAGQI